jgi:nifR3 family TIM-barrel protein
MNLKDKKFLAPMSGINDIAFRILCKRHGADITSIGLISAEALIRKNKATMDLIRTSKAERPVSIQLFGNEEKKIRDAVKIIEPYADIIDFNFGCPSFKIIKQGYGAWLLQYPDKVRNIVKALRQSTNKPLTIKIRAGLNSIDYNQSLNIAKIIEEEKADALIIHPRSAKQGYSGKADWNLIKVLKSRLKITIVGNGDIFNSNDLKKMIDETGCDSVMVGRGALGNPLIFSEKNKGELKDIKKTFLEYLDIALEHNINKFAHIKMHAMFFFKGFGGSSDMRAKLSTTKNLEQLKELIESSQEIP